MESKLCREFLFALAVGAIGVTLSPLAKAQEYPGIIYEDGPVSNSNEVIISEVILSETPLVSNEVIISEVILNVGQELDGVPTPADPQPTPSNAGASHEDASIAGASSPKAVAKDARKIDDPLDKINKKIDQAVKQLLNSHGDDSTFGDQVDSIQQQNAAIQKLLAERDATLRKISKSVSAQAKKTDANAKAIGELSEKMDGLAERKPSPLGGQLKKQLQSQTEKIDGLAKQLEATGKAAAKSGSGAKELRDLRASVEEQSEKIDNLVEGASETMEGQGKRMADLSKKLDGLSKSDTSDELKALSGKLDKALKAVKASSEDSTSSDQHSEQVASKIDEVLKAIKSNQSQLEKLAKTKATARPVGGNKAMAELKSSLTTQAERSTAAERKLDELLKSIKNPKSSVDPAIAEKHAKQMASMEKKLKTLKSELEARDQKLEALHGKLVKREKADAEHKKRHGKELDKSLAEVIGMLDRTKKRVDRLHDEATKLHEEHEHGDHEHGDHEHGDHEHGDHGDASHDEHQSARGKRGGDAKKDAKKAVGKAAAVEATADEPQTRSPKDGDVKQTTDGSAKGKQGGDIDPLRRRLDELKRRLKKARQGK